MTPVEIAAASPRASKFEDIARELRFKIQRGQMLPGDRLPPVSQMREAFGAAPMTVEKAYALLEREGLVVRANGRGVFVASDRKRSTGLLAMAGPIDSIRAPNEYYARLGQGFRRAAQEAGRSVLLCEIGSKQEWSVWNKTDGVVFLEDPTFQGVKPEDMGVPGVVAMLDTWPNLDCALADDADGIHQAVQHLLYLGHRRIGYVITDFSSVVMQVRLQAFHAALDVAGIEVQPHWVRMPLAEENDLHVDERAVREMNRWLESDWTQTGCSALLAQNDEAAIGVVNSLEKAGLHVPDDVSVVGFDDLRIARLAKPTLTTVGVPLEKIGEECAQLLLHPATEVRRRILPVQLVVRRSTAPVRLGEPG